MIDLVLIIVQNSQTITTPRCNSRIPPYFQISDYKLNYAIQTKFIKWAEDNSVSLNTSMQFKLSVGSGTYDWYEPKPPPSQNLWTVDYFPQYDWRYQRTCQEGTQCNFIPIAPSGRYMHTAVLYRSWSHQDAYENMCAGEAEPAKCVNEIDICHYDLSCLATTEEPDGAEAYYDRTDIKGNYFYRTERFINNDDGKYR